MCVYSQHRATVSSYQAHSRGLLIHTGTFLAQLISLSPQIHSVGLYLCWENKQTDGGAGFQSPAQPIRRAPIYVTMFFLECKYRKAFDFPGGF